MSLQPETDCAAQRMQNAVLRVGHYGLVCPFILVSMALMAMRLVPLVTSLALSFGVGSASAQVPGADVSPYPLEADRPAAEPATKPVARKPLTFPAASKATALAVAAPAKPEAARSAVVPIVIPPIRPEAAKRAVEQETAKSGATSDVFAGISQDERLKLQAALLWSGDYAGAVNGEDPMLIAVKSFQKRIKSKVTGRLTGSERAALIAAAREHEKEFGWSVVADPATGIRIGLPTKMVPNVREATRGTRWSSKHGEVQVETFRVNEPALKLSALFEQEKKEPASRKIEYSVLRDDGYFVSGLQGLKRFSVRAAMRNGEVRGFTMLYDQAMEGIVAPVMVAMASAFSPFPQRSAPFAALARSVEYGNGLIVSAQGHIVTDARVTRGCRVIVAPEFGDAERVAEDKDTGLALLRIYAPRKFKPLPLASDITAASAFKFADLTLTGIPDPKEQDGDGKLVEIQARLSDGNSIELRESAPMAGLSGAAVLDSQGRLLGMAAMCNAVIAGTEPLPPPVRLVRAAAIRGFLDEQQVPEPAATASRTSASASVARIICVRK